VPGVGTTHHVKIGNQYHLIRPGSYVKKAAPQFGARFTSGDPDYNNLSFWQHWVQTCWIGGMDADTWIDDAMYDEAVGVDTSQHEVMMLTRDLGRGSAGYALSGEVARREFVLFWGNLYCVQFHATLGRVYRLTWATDTWSLIHSFGATEVGSVAPFGGYLWFGTSGTNLVRMDPSQVFTNVAKPVGQTDASYTMKSYRDRLYVTLGRKIYRYKADATLDGSTVFYEAVGIDYLRASEIHLGFLYMASNNGHILRTDGNNTFDLWSMDAGSVVTSMRSFDGKLFVAANEPLAGTTETQGVLYQFTGAAVTELKRWGDTDSTCTLGVMHVAAKKLFYGASNLLGMALGFGIAVYDPVEDSHSIFASNRDHTLLPRDTEGVGHQVDAVYWFKGYLFITVRNHGLFKTKYQFRDFSRAVATYDTTASGGSPAAGNGGWITSSEFDGGTPGLTKIWNQVTLHVDLPTSATSVVMEYSTDGGTTWNYVSGAVGTSTVTGTGSPVRVKKNWKIPGSLKATRFKWRMHLRTTDATKTPQVRGVVVRYLPVPDPNWMWDMVLVLSEEQELLDGTVETGINPATKLASLEATFRQQNLVEFIDIDGTAWALDGTAGVLIYDINERVVMLGPSSDGPIEREVRITLIEAVEHFN
jgi:hypothetical protein